MKTEKVTKVTKVKTNSACYDITTTNHNFFANGFLVHNCQNVFKLLAEYANEEYYESEKLEGQSFTAYLNNDVYGVCSRNLELKLDVENAWTFVSKKYEIEDKLRKFGKNIALQGEQIGPGIQENIYQLTEIKLRLFNIFDIDKQEYYSYDEFIETVKQLGLETVPILNDNFKLSDYDLNSLLNHAEGKSVLFDTEREGIVIRAKKETHVRSLGRLSFKAISNRYLLNEK